METAQMNKQANIQTVIMALQTDTWNLNMKRDVF